MLHYCQISWTEYVVRVIITDWGFKKQKLNLRNVQSEHVQQPGSIEDSLNECRHRELPLQQEGRSYFHYSVLSPGTGSKPAVHYGPKQANVKLPSFGTCSKLVIAAQNWSQICNTFPTYVLLTWLCFFSLFLWNYLNSAYFVPAVIEVAITCFL